MAENERSVRSAQRHDPGHRGQQLVHDAAERERASAFYLRVASEYGTDLDLEALICESRKIDPGPAF